jgi:hypothetical protein
MTPHVAPVTPDVLSAFLAVMGEAERADLESIGGMPALQRAVALSVHTFAGIVDGKPAFVGGVIPDEDHVVGKVWMLGAPGIAKARKFYLRETRRQVALMLEMFVCLRTAVAAEYTKSLRWLRWLGFALGQPVKMAGRTLVPVERWNEV